MCSGDIAASGRPVPIDDTAKKPCIPPHLRPSTSAAKPAAGEPAAPKQPPTASSAGPNDRFQRSRAAVQPATRPRSSLAPPSTAGRYGRGETAGSATQAGDRAGGTPRLENPGVDRASTELSHLDWAKAAPARRSEQGRNGVKFLQLPNQTVVAKLGRTVHNEWLATEVAKPVGCQVPAPMLLTCSTTLAMRRSLESKRDEATLLMSMVAGHCFSELLEADQAHLRTLTPRGRGFIRQIGHVCALDYLIGNADRLPARV